MDMERLEIQLLAIEQELDIWISEIEDGFHIQEIMELDDLKRLRQIAVTHKGRET